MFHQAVDTVAHIGVLSAGAASVIGEAVAGTLFANVESRPSVRARRQRRSCVTCITSIHAMNWTHCEARPIIRAWTE